MDVKMKGIISSLLSFALKGQMSVRTVPSSYMTLSVKYLSISFSGGRGSGKGMREREEGQKEKEREVNRIWVKERMI